MHGPFLSISTEGRTLLRTQGFKVVLGAKNLGAHVQLSRKHTNSALQDRILDMTDIWPRLRLSACRYGNKIKALVTAAWPRALHAIAANTVSDASFQKLRAGAVKGLGVDGAGVNAWIQLGLIEQATVDPQCWAILQTFRCIRDCGDKGRVLKMLSALAYGDATQPANSFTMTLLARVQFLGWHVTPQGTLYDCLGEFCLFSCCLTELRMRIGWAWQMVVAQQVKHRWGLRDLQFADPTDTRLWLAGLSYDDQALFQKCLNGSHITQDCKVHCQEAGSDLCPFCQSVDSRFHRFWVCEKFEPLRATLPDSLRKLVADAPDFLTCYGWSVRPHTLRRWYVCLHQICVPPPPYLLEVTGDLHFFTDGSCLNQHHASCRVASWSVVRAWTSADTPSEVIDSGPLPGMLQSSYRAEIYAIYRALLIGRAHPVRLFLWTDCNAVVKRFLRLQRGLAPRPNSAHADLWLAIAECLSDFPHEVTITKVLAHQKEQHACSPLEDWCIRNNALADKAALLAQWRRPEGFWSEYACHVNAVQASRDFSRAVQRVILAISKEVVRAMDEPDVELREELCCSPEVPAQACRAISALHIPPAATRWYGDGVVRQILSWYWQNTYGNEFPTVWVSQFQLYIDFMLAGGVGPIKLTHWQAGSSRPELELLNIPFQRRTRWFCKVLKEALRHHGLGISYQYCRPVSRALNLHTGCLATPWPPDRLAAVDDWIFRMIPIGVHRNSKALDSLPTARPHADFPTIWISTC